MNLPNFGNYGNYSSDNYGAHTLFFNIGNITIYFSYKTPIAFESPKTGLVVSENIWSRTTGKHLNWIQSDASKRISHCEFEEQLEKLMKDYIK